MLCYHYRWKVLAWMPLVVSKAMHFLPHAEHLLSQTLGIAHVDRWIKRATFLLLQFLSVHPPGFGPPRLHSMDRWCAVRLLMALDKHKQRSVASEAQLDDKLGVQMRSASQELCWTMPKAAYAAFLTELQITERMDRRNRFHMTQSLSLTCYCLDVTCHHSGQSLLAPLWASMAADSKHRRL